MSRHQLKKELFEGARSRSKSERAEFLALHCAEDEALRREVERLLELHDESSDFLAKPAIGADFQVPEPDRLLPPTDEEIPDRIGHYEIIGTLGEGGMGTVYRAQQENPRRLVALKVIRSGRTSRAGLRRFEHEAQLLARLQHPGIARIYEAGTFGSGRAERPFFAMELVKGQPLGVYCDAHGLGTRERLALVARVCDAVQHAHQHGVVHRDLKPGNILVDESGEPRILDFGVARATDSDLQVTTLGTDVGQLLGTLPYMSPEQVAGDPRALDTRSDVYALGVVCYELLAGRLPLDVQQKTIPEAARIIQESDPSRLSTIDRTFRGDVDTIVGTALEKDKERRYQTASGLAADIRRYLADQPLVARPASTLYQLRKFTKRNKALVGGVTLTFAALLAATIISTVFWGRTELEASRATTINEFLTGMLRSVDPGEQNRVVSVREVLDEAAATIGASFADEPLIEAELRRTIARSYRGLGSYGVALDHAERALRIQETTLGEDDPDTLASMNLVALLLDDLGRYDESEPLMLRSLDLHRRVLGPEHADTLASETNLARLYYKQGRRDEAETMCNRTLEACRRVLGEEHPTTLDTMGQLAGMYHEQGRYDEAETLYVPALATQKRVLGEEHPTTLDTMNVLGRLYHSQSRYEEAETLLSGALAIQERVLGEEHADTLRCMNNLGWLYTSLGRYQEAVDLHTRELELWRRVFGDEHPGTPYAMNNLALAHEGQRQLDESEALKVEALSIRRRVLGEEHPDTLASMNNLAALYYFQNRHEQVEPLWVSVLEIRRRVLGAEHPDTLSSMNNLALHYTSLRRNDEAEPLYVETLEIRRRLLGVEHPQTLTSLNNLGLLYHRWGRSDKALPFFDESVATARRSLPAGHWFIGMCVRSRGEALVPLERFEEAETDLLEAHAILETARGADHPLTIGAIGDLVLLYDAWQRPEQAAPWRSRAESASAAAAPSPERASSDR